MIFVEEKRKEEIMFESDMILKEMINDVFTAKEEIFNRSEYYTRKYQKYSDLIRNVNLSVRYNTDKKSPQITLYVEDKYSKIRVELYTSPDGKEIIEQITNMKTKEMKGKENKNFITVEVPLYSPETKHMTNIELYDHVKSVVQEFTEKEVAYLEEGDYPVNNHRIFKLFFTE